MSGRLRVMRAGPGVTIQDCGRHGHLRFGVTPAGPMDWIAHQSANLIVGNSADAAALEISVGGIDLVCENAPVTLAFCGGAFAWTRDGNKLPFAARIALSPGERLAARAGAWGAWCVLALHGGIDVPPVMGSRATHTRTAIGGFNGRALADGDVLEILASDTPVADAAIIPFDAPWLAQDLSPIRVVLGPQDDYFSGQGIADFFKQSFRLTPMADRMAYRFEGPQIEHSKGFNIISDGMALGAIQIGGDGNPLIMMADRAPTGGYPKIGHVARADISRLAQMRPGEHCQFVQVTPSEARAALIVLQRSVEGVAELLTQGALQPTTEALLSTNLIGGVVSG